MSTEEILRAGIAAARSGELERARGLFAQVVTVDPASEQGWLLLGLCCSVREQREYCFRRVLAINPNNSEARRQLERLSGPAPSPPRPQREAAQGKTPSLPASHPMPPAVSLTHAPKPMERDDSAPALSDPGERFASEREGFSSGAAARASLRMEVPGTRPPSRKRSSPALVLILSFTLTFLIGGSAAAFLILSGQPGWMLFSLNAPQPPAALVLPAGTGTLALPLAVDATASLSPTVLPTPKPTLAYTPRFEPQACWFEIPSGANVSCGYVVVPENRAGDPSRTIRLAVAVYHSTSPHPAPDPVLFLQGGPGGEAVNLSVQAYEALVAPFLSERDFIAFDQRGTGLSEPALKCEEITKIYSQDIHGLIPAATRKLVYPNALLSCNALMRSQGIDLNAYTTVASAADLRDLLVVLGYSRVNLYGVSYGTRLAQVVMRDYPEIVRSAILDSVVPIETSLLKRYPEAVESALRNLFDGCAANSECSAAYPQLETVFWQLVDQLDAQPVPITTSFYPYGTVTENVDGTTFMAVILGSIKESGLIATAPQSIYRFKEGDYSTFIVTQAALPFAFEGISLGLYISMMCHEHILTAPLEELQTVNASRANIREYAWLPFYGNAEDLLRECKSWGATGPTLGENTALASDIPTLIVAGKYDPTTPPRFAQEVGGRLSRSYYFEFPDQGHAPTATDASGCAMKMALAFLDHPEARPDATCLDQKGDVRFLVPYMGNPALTLKWVSVNGISARVPEEWTSSGDGFYLRRSSPLDITQVGVLQANVSVAELKDWLSSKAYGYRGLDVAPIQAGQRRAHGLTWTLYTSTSYGRPVDMAMADYRGHSLVAVVFCNQDEHEAIYQTVFLPLVDSIVP